MNDLCIVSCDKLFIRMLELELLEIGINVKKITEKLNPPALKLALNNFSAVVFDADYYGGDLGFIQKCEQKFVLFSSKNINTIPENVTAFFERPFPVSKFVGHISELLFPEKSIRPIISENTVMGNIELDIYSKQAVINGSVIKFSPREFSLLQLLYKNRGRIVSRKEVIETIWGKDYDMSNNADNVYINYLRKKLDDFFGVKIIYTIRGKGYMMK